MVFPGPSSFLHRQVPRPGVAPIRNFSCRPRSGMMRFMVICGHCQSQNSASAKYCLKCGAVLKAPRDRARTPAGKMASGGEAVTIADRPPESSGRTAGPARPAPRKKQLAARRAVPARAPTASQAAVDVEPLIAEEAKARIAEQLERAPVPALSVRLNFPRALVAGYGSIVEAK